MIYWCWKQITQPIFQITKQNFHPTFQFTEDGAKAKCADISIISIHVQSWLNVPALVTIVVTKADRTQQQHGTVDIAFIATSPRSSGVLTSVTGCRWKYFERMIEREAVWDGPTDKSVKRRHTPKHIFVKHCQRNNKRMSWVSWEGKSVWAPG